MSVRATWCGFAAALVVTWISAWPGAFQYDDWNIVVHNRDVHGFAAWLASMPGIRPLTKATYALNWSLDDSPAGFVAFNLACHAASATLLLVLLRQWMPALDPAARRPQFAALVAALVFALHPAQTEAVTYIAGRSVSLAACLYLAALLAWERARTGARTAGGMAVSAALFAAALASRETAWTLPFAIAIVEIARRGAPIDRKHLWRLASDLRWHLAVLALAVLAFVASPTYRRLAATSLALRDPLHNLGVQVDAIAYLVTHPLLTLRVNLDPDIAASSDLVWLGTVVAILAALALGLVQLSRRPWLGAAILWFFLHLLPTNGAIARLDLANDRQLYLAMIGPAMAVGVVLARWQPARGSVATALIVAALGVATMMRNLDYRSEVALWEATARRTPAKARVWNNLGYAYAVQDDRARAGAAFERALALDPGHQKAGQNLRDLGIR